MCATDVCSCRCWRFRKTFCRLSEPRVRYDCLSYQSRIPCHNTLTYACFLPQHCFYSTSQRFSRLGALCLSPRQGSSTYFVHGRASAPTVALRFCLTFLKRLVRPPSAAPNAYMYLLSLLSNSPCSSRERELLGQQPWRCVGGLKDESTSLVARFSARHAAKVAEKMVTYGALALWGCSLQHQVGHSLGGRHHCWHRSPDPTSTCLICSKSTNLDALRCRATCFLVGIMWKSV